MTEFTPIPAIDGFVEALGTSITHWEAEWATYDPITGTGPAAGVTSYRAALRAGLRAISTWSSTTSARHFCCWKNSMKTAAMVATCRTRLSEQSRILTTRMMMTIRQAAIERQRRIRGLRQKPRTLEAFSGPNAGTAWRADGKNLRNDRVIHAWRKLCRSLESFRPGRGSHRTRSAPDLQERRRESHLSRMA